MLTRRSWLVYGVLLAIWLLLIGWQTAEHLRVRRTARASLVHRAKDISETVALIMRSQRLFSSTERIESILNELVKQGEIQSISLLNATNGSLASAGPKIELPPGGLVDNEYWNQNEKTLTLVNPVDLGTTNIIIPRSEFGTNRPPPREERPPEPASSENTNIASASNTLVRASSDPGPPPGNFTNGRPRRPRLSPEELKALRETKGTHGFVMVISAEALADTVRRDLWLRAFISLLATISVAGYGLAWSNVSKTSELQIRLVRASELNTHLRDLNLAAAGLAHETRNPLNIVRGLAQMISKQEDASPEIRLKSKEIIHETDRVASQLNEFINYSRPREVRRVATRLNSTVSEVIRALNYDIEEKKVRVENQCEDLVVEADEQLLRQALFNLVMNAIQAIKPNGEIIIRGGRQGGSPEAFVEICDNGPGVAPEHRAEIFKPYFTMHEEGTGLGLAVVQQIVLAHGWEIQCLPNQPTGACFRITHLKVVAKG
ncbi:MAG TPA: ATP-binding protein [Verrucomicrobiae bacterium]|nr:ATP-binding protein [Verrucomicrobiae bacterium]